MVTIFCRIVFIAVLMIEIIRSRTEYLFTLLCKCLPLSYMMFRNEYAVIILYLQIALSNQSCNKTAILILIMKLSLQQNYGLHFVMASFDTYEHTSWCMACSKCWVFTTALTFPAELDAQYGVIISILLSQASNLQKSHIIHLFIVSNTRN